jgi:hypothetical protein
MFACSTFDFEDGGNFPEFLRNLGIFLPDYTVLHPRKCYVPFIDTAVGTLRLDTICARLRKDVARVKQSTARAERQGDVIWRGIGGRHLLPSHDIRKKLI